MFKVTPAQVRAAYELIRRLPPFCEWDLPPANNGVTFGVNNARKEYGRYTHLGRGVGHPGFHRIDISRHNVKTLHALTLTMAHEVLHLRQQLTRTHNRAQHNAEFLRLARRVCLSLGLDSKGFT